jgi:hypothetical protein
MWLGNERGHLADWTTQLWVKATGRITTLQSSPWLDGPTGKTTGIGLEFFDEFASEHGLVVRRGTGLIHDFSILSGPAYKLEDIAPGVRDFYQQTADYELDAWSEWCGIFRPFGRLLAHLFSHRLQQLNVPLSSLDTSQGVTSRILDLVNAQDGLVRYTAWVRQLLGTRNVLYAGSYSLCTVPAFSGVCVKVVFPLPNGSAVVIMYPESGSDGSLFLTSAGSGYGSPGFYFTVHDGTRMWVKYVRALQETIRVYAAGGNQIRADHVVRFWGMTFLRLHYRLRRVSAGEGVASIESTVKR